MFVRTSDLEQIGLSLGNAHTTTNAFAWNGPPYRAVDITCSMPFWVSGERDGQDKTWRYCQRFKTLGCQLGGLSMVLVAFCVPPPGGGVVY